MWDNFLGLVCVLTILAAVGGLIWVLAALTRRFAGAPDADPTWPRGQVKCPGCRMLVPASAGRCRFCGLRNVGAVVAELRDLAAVTRQIERFRNSRTVDVGTLNALDAAVARRRRLLERATDIEIEEPAEAAQRVMPVAQRETAPGKSEPVVAPAPKPAGQPGADLPWRRLEELLERCPNVEDLAPTDRVHALLWLRQSENDQLARMSAVAQLGLARLLRSAGRHSEALRAFWRLLDSRAQLPAFVEVALEAGQYALAEKVPSQARWFFEQALLRVASPERRREIGELLRECREGSAPVRDEVADVQPAEVEPVVRAERRPAEPVGVGPACRAGPGREATPEERIISPQASPPEVPLGKRDLPRPRRSLLDLLTAFMEERNILWGELIGGLLIVGCSFALAMHLQARDPDNPYLPSFLFGTISAALIGVGLYTLRRWKLDFTSRGLLVDGLLMVPLVFPFTSTLLAGSLLGKYPLPVAIGIITAFLLVFAGLVALAARVLVFDGRWLLPLVVMGASVSQVLVAPVLEPNPELPAWRIILLGFLPVACFVLAGLGTVVQTSRRGPLEIPQVKGLFYLLGISAFAVVAALMFQIKYLEFWGLRDAAFELLAPPIALAGIPILATGLLIHLGLAAPRAEAAIQEGPETGQQHKADLASLRTVGTGLALVGVFVMLVGVVLAWPLPRALLWAAGIDFAVLTFVAFRWRLPILHAAALPCLVVGFLTGLVQIRGHVDGTNLLSALLSADSATALVGLVAAILGVSEYLTFTRPGDKHGKFYAVGAAVVAALSLAVVTRHGPQHTVLAAAVYGIYGGGCVALNLARWRRPVLSYVGLGLLFGATLWTLHAGWHGQDWTWAAVLASEALGLAALAVVLGESAGSLLTERRDVRWFRTLMPACRDVAAIAAAAGLVFAALAQKQLAPAFSTYTGVTLTGAALLLAWAYGTPLLTWVGSTLLLGTLCVELPRHFLALANVRPGLLGLLSHASIVLAASLGLRTLQRGGTRLRQVFIEPLGWAALVSSLLVFPFLLTAPYNPAIALSLAPPQITIHAGYFAWLAGVWLVLAWSERQAWLFTAFQVALTVAVLFGVLAGLVHHEWFRAGYPDSFQHPWSLQAFGIGLGLLSLAWIAVRITWDRLGRQRPAWQAAKGQMLALAADPVVFAFVVCGQLGLAVWGVLPGLIRELTAAGNVAPVEDWPAGYAAAYGPGAWLLLAIVAVALVAALWEWIRAVVAVGLAVAAVSVPVLLAGPFEGQLATASALRWGLGACFLACSAVLWLREPLGRTLVRFGCDPSEDMVLPVLTRATLMLASIVPVFVLTTIVASIGFSGLVPSGPAAESFFGKIGPVLNNVAPLALVSVGLVGYALRERSAGHAFGAGVLVDVTVMGGYALGVVTSGQEFGAAALVQMIQLGTVAAAVWALGWLSSRWWVDAWRERPEAPLAGPLMAVQLYLPAAGNIFLLLGGLAALVFAIPDYGVLTVEAGSVLGWLALVLGVAAGGLYLYQKSRPVPVANVGLIGLAVTGLLACSVEAWLPGGGYRALMLGWALFAVVLAGTMWCVETNPTAARFLALRKADGAWVPFIGLLVVFLGLATAIVNQDHLWAAAAVAVVSSACAVVALWKRDESWAVTAGFGTNLAVSLIVWHYRLDVPFDGWWMLLLQANVIATAVVASGWLWARRHLALGAGQQALGAGLLTPPPGRLLGGYISLGLAGNLILLGLSVLLLLLAPGAVGAGGPSMAWVAQAGQPAGWLALLLGMTAAAGYVHQARTVSPFHFLCAMALGVGVLAACTASNWDQGNWLTYHILTGAWTFVAAVVLLVGGAGGEAAALRERGDDRHRWLAGLVSLAGAQPWFHAIATAVLLLAIRGAWTDPARPYVSTSVTMTVSVLYGVLAVWARRLLREPSPVAVVLSGLLVNLTGIILWLAWGPRSLDAFVCTNVFCLAVAAGTWALVEWVLRTWVPSLAERSHPLTFRHVAVQAALIVLATRCVLAVTAQLSGEPALPEGLAWLAVGATMLAVLLGLWDPAARFTRCALYALGLVAITLGLDSAHLSPPDFFWTAGLALAGYVLSTTALSWGLPLLAGLDVELPVSLGEGEPVPSSNAIEATPPPPTPAPTVPWPEPWFAPVQLALSGIVIALSVWMSVAFGTLAGRLVGSLAAALLLPAGVLAVLTWQRRERGVDVRSHAFHFGSFTLDLGPLTFDRLLRYATLAVGVIAVVEASWSGLDPAAGTSWLHRSVVLMAVLAGMTVVYGVGLARLLSRRPLSQTSEVLETSEVSKGAWSECGRRLGPVLGVLASLTVFAILAQEGFLYDPLLKRAPMLLPAAVAVAVALVVLIAGGIAFAVLPGSDPFGLSERARTFYVYGSELLLVLLYVHLKVTMPQLFHGLPFRAIPFVILLIAFVGVALSEFFRRQGLRVLAEPLQNTGFFLPVLPLLAFWTLPPGRQHFGDYAILWFLVGIFFTAVAVVRRSFRFALVAALSANFGLWVLLFDNKLSFLSNPQLWLVPGALIALVAEYLNRDRLTAAQANAVRYLALSVLYLSSTAEMFLRGLGEWRWGPVILAVLAVFGVLVGMALRVRAFLVLGVLFLLLDVVTEVCYFASAYTWVWWASGIILGAAIVILFALFEKRRNEMLELIEAFKKWQ